MAEKFDLAGGFVIALLIGLVIVLGCVKLGREIFMGELRQSGLTVERVWPAQGEPYWRVVEAP